MRLTSLAAVFLACPAATLAAGPLPLKPDRTAENYSHLRDPAARGAEAAYKFVPLTCSGSVFASLGGDVRERVESADAPRFGIGGTKSDTYLLQRVLLHADLRAGGNVRLFAQLGAHEAFGKKQLLPVDEDHLDVDQLFLEVMPTRELSLRLGRQEMAFNAAQRFVSFRDGTNIRQSFDGARVTLKQGRMRIEAFAVRPVVLEPGVFDDESNDEQSFAGAYASLTVPQLGGTLDAYWFHLGRDKATFGGVTGNERRHSIGMRFAGASAGWDWDAEALVQRGRFGSRDISAWALAADVGRTLQLSPGKLRLGLRLDAGSGDSGNKALGTFNPLFPKGPYFNEANLTSFANLVALRPAITVQPTKMLSIEAAAQFKWKEAKADAVYLNPLPPLAGTRGGASEIGQVYSLDATVQLGRHWSLRGYYLHHTVGDAIRQAGGRAIDFVMTSAQLRF